MKKQNNKITENEFNVARESFLSNSLSVEQKRSMFDNILKSSSATVSLDGAKGADENAKAGIESGSTEPIGRMHDVKGKGDNADFKTISLGKTLGIVSFIQPHMLKQKVFITLLILIVFLAGTSFASTYSLPGDLLYTVKVRVLEPLVITTKLSTEAKIQHRIALLDKRIDELNKLDSERIANENIVKKSVYVTQQNIKYLERSAKLILDENNLKISTKIHEYNQLLEKRISGASGLKAGLNTISDIFASSTASSTGTLNATSTNTNAERPGERSEARSGLETGASSSTLYQRQYINATVSAPVVEKPEQGTTNPETETSIRTIITAPKVEVVPIVGEVVAEVDVSAEVKPEINSWIKSDIFKVIK